MEYFHKIQQKVQFKNKYIRCSHESIDKLHYEVDFSTFHNHFLEIYELELKESEIGSQLC